MNERIKKIAKDAGVLGDWGEDALEGRFFITGNTKQMEKFAELIIKDCLDVVTTRMNLGTVELCRQECKALTAEIKHHFDVEE